MNKIFDSIRDEPEFQQILHDVETKYFAEHERVRLWLEENDRLMLHSSTLIQPNKKRESDLCDLTPSPLIVGTTGYLFGHQMKTISHKGLK